jgi:hypothetical protein
MLPFLLMNLSVNFTCAYLHSVSDMLLVLLAAWVLQFDAKDGTNNFFPEMSVCFY